MKAAERLLESMVPDRVYRCRQLTAFSRSPGRDLQRLVRAGQVKKLAWGLYCRPRKNAFGEKPPEDRELVREFLKTDNFLLTSFNHFNQLGFGLTQVYNNYWVYNHKRSGEKELGGKRFRFRVVADYPTTLDREYLLVDLLNNLKRLPDDAASVLENLSRVLPAFDSTKVLGYANQYGSPATRNLLLEGRA